MRVQKENRKSDGKSVTGKYSSQFPLLVERAKFWGFEIPTNQPRGNAVIVWRLPPVHEKKIEGTDRTLIIPDDHDSPHIKGVLIAASASALSAFQSEGITLGHIVQWKRFAGEEQNEATPEALKGQRLLWLQASDILASDDLMTALESGDLNYVEDGGRLKLEGAAIPGQRKQLSGKKAKLLALAERGGTPAERETAKRLAEQA